jgi:hypothetical protein
MNRRARKAASSFVVAGGNHHLRVVADAFDLSFARPIPDQEAIAVDGEPDWRCDRPPIATERRELR